MMAAQGATLEGLFARLTLLMAPSTTHRVPDGADIVIAPDQVLADGRETTDGWSEIGVGLAEAAGYVVDVGLVLLFKIPRNLKIQDDTLRSA